MVGDVSSSVAKILTLISRSPNPRDAPREGDVKGDFDMWFDGGAVKHQTGISKYCFLDGTSATTGSSSSLHVHLQLPSGHSVCVLEGERKLVGKACEFMEGW